jgi:hypothetical protein
VTTEVIGDATLHLGDCRDILPDVRGEIVITDPVWPNAPEGMFPGVKPEKLLREAFKAMPWCQRAVIVLRSDSDPRFLRAVPRRLPFFLCQWLQYAMPMYIGRKLGGNEVAYSFGEPAASQPGRRVIPGNSPKAQPAGRRENGHPCGRNYEHFDWLMRWHTDPGQVVVDPFMGSATTGYSAIRAGRKFVGIEIEPKYFAIACERIEQAQKQQRLFA